MSEWISIKDKLPEIRQEIILLINGYKVMTGFMEEENIFYCYGCIRIEKELVELDPIGPGRLTHWMPLPEPPND